MDSPPVYDIRRYRRCDLPSLAAIYSGSIRHLGPAHYSAAQVVAWARFADDVDRFRAWIEQASTYVAVAGGEGPAGFAGLVDRTHVASVFVAPGFQRMGIASALLVRLLGEAAAANVAAVTAKASEFSKPLFEKHGFVVSEVEYTAVDGVPFSRYAMRLCLQARTT